MIHCNSDIQQQVLTQIPQTEGNSYKTVRAQTLEAVFPQPPALLVTTASKLP